LFFASFHRAPGAATLERARQRSGPSFFFLRSAYEENASLSEATTRTSGFWEQSAEVVERRGTGLARKCTVPAFEGEAKPSQWLMQMNARKPIQMSKEK